MRKIAALGALWGAASVLAGCSEDPDFDARFQKANAEIQQRIDALDAEEARLRAELGLVDPDGVERQAAPEPSTATAGALNFHLPVPDGMSKVQASSGE